MKIGFYFMCIIFYCLNCMYFLSNLNAQITMPDTVCAGTTKTYKVNDSFTLSTYTWAINGVHQNATKNEINITWSYPGIFTLSVQEHGAIGCDGDVVYGLVNVIPLPVSNAGNDSSYCFGIKPQLNGSGGNIYKWNPITFLSNPNIANPVINSSIAGTFVFWLNVANTMGCKSANTDTVIITIIPPLKIFAGNDTLVAINKRLQLFAADINNVGFKSYSWMPATGLNNSFIQNPIATLNNDISYTVTATLANGCTAKDDINIKTFIAPGIYVPNAFTPNGDGKNDVLQPYIVGYKQIVYFFIYNKFGEKIFSSSNINDGWDGTYKGTKQSMDTYVWVVAAIDYNGNTIINKGTAILIR